MGLSFLQVALSVQRVSEDAWSGWLIVHAAHCLPRKGEPRQRRPSVVDLQDWFDRFTFDIQQAVRGDGQIWVLQRSKVFYEVRDTDFRLFAKPIPFRSRCAGSRHGRRRQVRVGMKRFRATDHRRWSEDYPLVVSMSSNLYLGACERPYQIRKTASQIQLKRNILHLIR